ncbi:PPPDE putative thiol peptidase family protein [Abeliophyllum distichum]|uniref:PPPDE putative thiol peptidase family protein n=1 Tax=Abeliophyllum distichum TaxID=126358 RepID=A0ABD1Q7H4_9LAMI
MAEVIVHVYDVTNESPGYEAANFALVHLNTVCKEAVPIGGVFHTAVQVYGDEEWGYGECKQGSGVYSCPAGKNMQYSYRESIVLGRTTCSPAKRLGVPKLPAWVNRFANAGDVAYEAAQSLQKAKNDVINAGVEVYKNALESAIKTPKSLISLSKGAKFRTDQFKPKFITGRIAGFDQGAGQKST